jgi:hypothetical protein
MMGSNHRAIIPISAAKLLTLSQFVMLYSVPADSTSWTAGCSNESAVPRAGRRRDADRRSGWAASTRELPRPDGATPFADPGGCPSGYYRSGGFCAPTSRDSQPAVPKPPGANCPSGWYQSGAPCVKL